MLSDFQRSIFQNKSKMYNLKKGIMMKYFCTYLKILPCSYRHLILKFITYILIIYIVYNVFVNLKASANELFLSKITKFQETIRI